MGNCLVTKLKEVVQNNNLEKLGELRVKTVGTGTNDVVYIYSSKAQTLSIVEGDGTFVSTGNKEFPVVRNQHVHFFTTNDGDVVSIEDKYSIDSLRGKSQNGQNLSLDDLSRLRFCTNLTEITLKYVSGDISNLSELTSLGVLMLTNENVVGDIAVLGKLTSLHEVDIEGSHIDGKFENLFEGLYNNLKRAGVIDISIKGVSTNLGPTFHGQKRNGIEVTFNSTGCVVVNTYAGGALLGTLTNGVWTDQNGDVYVP